LTARLQGALEKEKESARLEAQLKAAEQRIEEIARQKAEASKEKADAVAALHDLSDRFKSVDAELSKELLKSQHLGAKVEDLSKEREAFLREKVEMAARLQSVLEKEKANARLEEQLKASEARVEEIARQKSELAKEKADVAAALQGLTDKFKATETELSKELANGRHLESRVEELSKEREAFFT